MAEPSAPAADSLAEPLERNDRSMRMLVGTSATDTGLLYGINMSRGMPTTEIELSDFEAIAPNDESVTWLHFNLGNARAREFLSKARFLPTEAHEVFQEQDHRRRVEGLDTGLLAVISDLAFESEADPAEVGPLWCYASDRLLLTARVHALRTTDQLRAAIRGGYRVDHPLELLTWIFSRRTDSLRQLTQEMSEQVSEIEEEIIGGAIKEQRVQLGRIRRFCARMRRHFAPDRSLFLKLLQRHAALFAEHHAESLRSEIEELSFLVDEAAELYERAKLLQEELASRVAEDTGRSLYVLAILSAVFLPMTLITGIFGMNVDGLPWLHSPAGFWIVMFLIVAAGALFFRIFTRTKS